MVTKTTQTFTPGILYAAAVDAWGGGVDCRKWTEFLVSLNRVSSWCCQKQCTGLNGPWIQPSWAFLVLAPVQSRAETSAAAQLEILVMLWKLYWVKMYDSNLHMNLRNLNTSIITEFLQILFLPRILVYAPHFVLKLLLEFLLGSWAVLKVVFPEVLFGLRYLCLLSWDDKVSGHSLATFYSTLAFSVIEGTLILFVSGVCFLFEIFLYAMISHVKPCECHSQYPVWPW